MSCRATVTFSDEVKEKFKEFQETKFDYLILTFEITPENNVELDLAQAGKMFEEFHKNITTGTECRIGLLRIKSCIFFVVWQPIEAKIKAKMLLCASKDYIKKSLPGVTFEVGANDPSDISLDILIDRIESYKSSERNK